jgi:hypothetical protein
VEPSDNDDKDDEDDEDEYQVCNHRRSRKRAGKAPEAFQPASRCSHVLKCGFQVPTFSPPCTSISRWSCDLPMKSIAFLHVELTRATNGHVSFKSLTEPDTILIADDWYQGEILARQGKPDKTKGYIGSGASKRSIYVRFLFKELLGSYNHCSFKAQYNGQEYALLMNKEGYPESDVERTLRTEYNLLLTAASFKAEFDSHTGQCGARLAHKSTDHVHCVT